MSHPVPSFTGYFIKHCGISNGMFLYIFQDTINQGICSLYIGLDFISQYMYPKVEYKFMRFMHLNKYKDYIPRGVYEPLNKFNNIESCQQL